MGATVRRCVLIPVLAAAASAAHAGDGLRLQPGTDVWPRLQARISVTLGPASAEIGRLALHGAHLFGDYYFSGPAFGSSELTGGFRATSGVLAGARPLAFGAPALPGQHGLALTLSPRVGLSPGQPEFDGHATVPYFGLGYTGLSVRGGWGFTADIGLMGSSVRLGRPAGPQGSVDELLRDLRLTPVLQLGVSYSF